MELEHCFLGLLIVFLLTVFIYLVYSGLFTRVEVQTCETAYGPLVVAYKTGTGPYRNVGDLYTESYCLLPHREQLGLYYDDPEAVPESELRYAVGPILAQGEDDKPDSKEMELMTSHGFRIMHLPKPSYVIAASFPFATTLSIYIGIFRVYPKLKQFIARRNLCAYPAVEVYTGDTINFFMPLSRQDEFFVPEFQDEDVSVATTEVGSPQTANNDETGDHEFLRPKTPLRENRPDRRARDQTANDMEDEDGRSSEESEDRSAASSSSFDDLSKDLVEKSRPS